MAAASWLHDRRLTTQGTIRWHVQIAIDVVDESAPDEFDDRIATRFHLEIYSEEWGVFFCHAGRASWIRVTDIAFVHGRDDHALLTITPQLKDIRILLRGLEQQHRVQFQRRHATIRTNLAQAEPAIRTWIAGL